MKTILGFFRPAIIFPIPKGIVPDPVGANGLFGLMKGANNYALSMCSTTTGASDVALTAEQVVKGAIQLNTGATGAFTITLPTTAQILGELSECVKQDGTFTKIIHIINNGVGQTGTLTAGDGATSISGTATIANDVCRQYAMRVLASAINFTNIGALAI
jgi:hypothetical protein